jgi:F-type H+-transporting ATPase subunit b
MELLTHFAASEKTGIAALGIDPVAILLQLTTFVLIFLILKKFAFKTIVTKLDERREAINSGVELGREMELEKQQLDEQVQKMLHKARLEADKIVAESHHEAGSIIKEAEDKAARKIDGMLADAHLRLEQDRRRLRTELEEELVSLVADATEKLLREKVDAKKDAVLISQALKEVRH